MPEQIRNKIKATETANMLAQTGDLFLKEWRDANGQKQ
jgi:hypothetical protein